MLKEHNIVSVQVQANCTDRLQPLDISINKDDVKKSFHSWYANEVQKQLQSAPVHEVKVDLSAAVIKTKSVSWFISDWESLQGHPEIVINGFKKTGIAVTVAI